MYSVPKVPLPVLGKASSSMEYAFSKQLTLSILDKAKFNFIDGLRSRRRQNAAINYQSLKILNILVPKCARLTGRKSDIILLESSSLQQLSNIMMFRQMMTETYKEILNILFEAMSPYSTTVRPILNAALSIIGE